MFIKYHYIVLVLILAGDDFLVNYFIKSHVDLANSDECSSRFFNFSVFSVWSIYIAILGAMPLFFEHRYQGSVLSSTKYLLHMNIIAGDYTAEAVILVKKMVLSWSRAHYFVNGYI